MGKNLGKFYRSLKEHIKGDKRLPSRKKPPVILDIGSSYARIGIAGEVEPRIVCLNLMGFSPRGGSYVYGDDVLVLDDVVFLGSPVRRGIVRDWDFWGLMVDYLVMRAGINPDGRNVIFVIHGDFAERELRRAMEILVEDIGFGGVIPLDASFLGLVASKSTTGIVVDLGGEKIQVSSFVDLIRITPPKQIPLGGWDITVRLAQLLRRKGFGFDIGELYTVVRGLKEEQCFVRINDGVVEPFEYIFDDGSLLALQEELYEAPEILFKGHRGAYPIQELLSEAIMLSHPDVRGELASNILLIGGTANLKNIGERLKKELELLLPKTLTEKINITTPRLPENAAFRGASFVGLIKEVDLLVVGGE